MSKPLEKSARNELADIILDSEIQTSAGIAEAILAAGYRKSDDDTYKASFEQYQRLIAFLAHQAGGEITIKRSEWMTFPEGWEVESSADMEYGTITIATRYSK